MIGSIRIYADMVELADTLDLGSNAVWCAGSSPVIRTISRVWVRQKILASAVFARIFLIQNY